MLLTFCSFLREKGIVVPRYNGYGRAVVIEEEAPLPVGEDGQPIPPPIDGEVPGPAVDDMAVDQEEETEEQMLKKETVVIRAAHIKSKNKKKKRIESSDSEDNGGEEISKAELLAIAPRSAHTKKKKIINSAPVKPLEIGLCGKCSRRFTQQDQSQTLCGACTSIPRARPQKKQTAAQKLKSEQESAVSSLPSICMLLISKHIQHIEDVRHIVYSWFIYD